MNDIMSTVLEGIKDKGLAEARGYHIEHLKKENDRLRATLTLIAAFQDQTLIAPSMGRDLDQAHQLGANKAFNQAAEIAASALKVD